MFKIRSIIPYLAIFLVLAVLLKVLGIIGTGYTELAAYVLIFFGIGTVYSAMGRNAKILLFVGVAAFLIGIELFITTKYEIVKLSNVVLPSIFFILGTAFLVLFIDDLANKLMLTISVIFLIAGIYFFNRLGNLNLPDILKSILSITIKYWPVIIIITAIILLIRKENKG
jgi:hypothetical protein